MKWIRLLQQRAGGRGDGEEEREEGKIARRGKIVAKETCVCVCVCAFCAAHQKIVHRVTKSLLVKENTKKIPETKEKTTKCKVSQTVVVSNKLKDYKTRCDSRIW